MDAPRFTVLFDGSLTGEVDEETARKRFARLFGISEEKAATYFTGRERVLKQDVSEEQAMAYMVRIAGIGCECYMEEVTEALPEGTTERRRNQERRQRFRREPRAGAIVPDRRLKIRRVIDRRHFRQLHDKGLDLPLALRPYPPTCCRRLGSL
ncbi:MAG: hypothetical protein U5O39_03910 [Gammaproteobacteria bacterium]|nr:hypothetical protein [Gammaproteobacteria bacterium]